jgi:hypothetical protein
LFVIIVTGVLNTIFDSDNKYKFNISLYLINWENTKWVYHSKLGFLLCEPNKVIIYQQEYFHRRKLVLKQSDINFTTHRLSIEIKNRFFVSKKTRNYQE